MKRFASFDGVEIAYDVLGEGDAVVMHHGFASDSVTNFVRAGVAEHVLASGFQVVLIDARGHGESGKPHDPAAYAGGAMVRDVACLLDILGLDGVHFLGYSMGSFVGMRLAAGRARASPRSCSAAPASPRSGPARRAAALRIAEALEAADPAEPSTDRWRRAFRNFADATEAPTASPSPPACSGRAAPSRARRSRPHHRSDSRPERRSGHHDGAAGGPRRGHPGRPVPIVPGDHLSAVVQPEFRQCCRRRSLPGYAAA